MQGLTGAVAFVGVVAVFGLRPISALCVYCWILLAYPQSLVLSLGTADLTTGRIVALALLIRAALNSRLVRSFAWTRLDAMVLLFFIGKCAAWAFNVAVPKLLERQGGALFDTVMPYFAARLILRDKTDVKRFLTTMVKIGILLSFVGIYQAITRRNPVGYLTGVFGDPNALGMIRHGLYRADATFGNAIGFGMFLVALAPICLGLAREKGWSPFRAFLATAIVILGVVSSMSTGPLFTLPFALGLVACFGLRHFWRPAVVFIVICCVFLEFTAKCHFYELPIRFAFNTRTAAYRVGLYNEAFEGGMSGHWLAGYGDVGIHPDSDNSNFDWYHKDFTSLYIGILARFGLLGFVPFLLMTVQYYRRLYRAAHVARGRSEEWFVWCFSSALIGWSIGTLTVGLVAQTATVFSLLIAAAGNMPEVLGRERLREAAANRAPEPAPSDGGDRASRAARRRAGNWKRWARDAEAF